MNIALGATGVEAIVLDIEGTTTPIAFVYDVLFPFARAHLREFLQNPINAAPLRELAAAREWLRRSRGVTLRSSPAVAGPALKADTTDGVEEYVESLMDRDRKSPGLKLLQGRIWEDGYRAGVLKGEVFADVPPALQRWRDAGLDVAIYSSGSELAQQLIFGSTADGDLTRFISRFFDTAVGAKGAPASYRRIAAELGRAPDRLLFISDVTSRARCGSRCGMRGDPVRAARQSTAAGSLIHDDFKLRRD